MYYFEINNYSAMHFLISTLKYSIISVYMYDTAFYNKVTGRKAARFVLSMYLI